jgi:hypothetical protein
VASVLPTRFENVAAPDLCGRGSLTSVCAAQWPREGSKQPANRTLFSLEVAPG